MDTTRHPIPVMEKWLNQQAKRLSHNWMQRAKRVVARPVKLAR